MSRSPIAAAVARVLHAALPEAARELDGMDPDALADLLAAPPKPEMGDLAFPCFKLAKPLKQAPAKIAASIAEAIDKTGIVAEASVAGIYLNLRLRLSEVAALVLPPLAAGIPEPTATRDERVMVEYSQPNTHKGFHVGHMRTLFLGDALVRLLRADGYPVVAANYLGDVGAHIAKCLWGYLDRLTDDERTPPDSYRGEWLGEVYSKASNQMADWEDAAKAGDTAAAEKFAQAKARTTEILQKLEARDPGLMAVWKQTRQWSLDDFDEIYKWSDVHFDRVFYESEVDEPGLVLVQEFLDKGVFVQSEGAVGIFNEEIKHMPFFMLRKTDGTSLYSTKDLALARIKFEEYDIDRSIYVVDTRQTDHFRHVFLTLSKMGFAQAQRCEHVPYEMVELTDGPMAARKGNVILFRELQRRLLAHLQETYLGKYRGEWPDEEIDAAAHAVAVGAVKYGMLNRDVNQKIVFDLEAWLNVEGNTGPYLQYATTRARSIVRKCEAAGKTLEAAMCSDADRARTAAEALVEPEERELILALDGLRPAAHQAAQSLRPHLLCTYLFNLARAFSRFGTSKRCNVLRSEGDLLQARLMLVTATVAALTWGLLRLGITAPPRM